MNYKKILLILLVPAALLAAAVGSFIYANKVVGIYSQQNFMLNGDFEKSTYGALLSGTVGSTSLSIVNTPSIFGNALEVTSPSAGLELLLAIDGNIDTISGLNCEARTNLYLFSANTVPMTLEVDVVRGTSLRISNMQPVTLSTSGWVPVSVNFPCAAITSASYIRVKVVSPGTVLSGNIIFDIDSVYAGEATNITNQAVVTDWQDFPSVAAGTLITATTTSPTYGTVVTNKAQYRYVGSDVEIKWDFRQTNNTGASTGSGQYLFNVPSSICVIDTNKAKANTGSGVLDTDSDSIGHFTGADTSVSASSGVTVYSSSALKVSSLIAAGSAQFRNTWNSSFLGFATTGSTFFSLKAKVPCVGRSATQSAITQQCIQDGSCENVFSAKVAADGTVSGENIDWINGNCTNANPRVCTYKTDFFGAVPSCTVTTSSGTQHFAALGTVNTTKADVMTFLDNGSATQQPFHIICQRSSTDYKPRFAAPVLVGSVTSNSQSALRVEYATVGGASESTFCSTSSCNIYNPSTTGTFTATRTSSGRYAVSWPSNTWSKVHNCSGSVLEATSGGGVGTLIFSSFSQTGVNVEIYKSYSTAAHEDVLFSIECKGTR